MEFDDQRVDVSGVSDRRGSGGLGRGVAIGGGGLGLVGVVVVLLLQLRRRRRRRGRRLRPDSARAGHGHRRRPGESQQELAERCNTEGAIDEYDDCYLIKVYNETDEVWAEELPNRGAEYPRPD